MQLSVLKRLRRWAETISRENYNWYGGLVSILGAVISLAVLVSKNHLPGLTPGAVGKVLVAIWAIAPPAFFWIDWVWFCRDMKADAPERDVARHTHDLARNIWIGFLALLTVGFFNKLT
jgi:hypothetical protein